MNGFKTFILMAAMTALFMGVGLVIGGRTGLMVAFGMAVLTNAFTYWNADTIVLKMYRAKRMQDGPLFDMVQRLADGAGLPMPKVYIVENPQPNAFATGRNPNHAAVAATTGILDILDRDELAGVMAHELAHIQNRDTLTMTITATLAGAISVLANMAMFMGGRRDGRGNPLAAILVMILAPIGASLVQMAISRTREFSADRDGAKICGNPMALAGALQKLNGYAARVHNSTAERNPATAHMFIVNPLRMGGGLSGLFRTHPPMEDRVRELEKLAGLNPIHPTSNPWA